MEDINKFLLEIGRPWAELMLPQVYLATTVTDFVKHRRECKNTPLHKYLTILPLILTRPPDSITFIYNVDVQWTDKEKLFRGGVIKDITAQFPFRIIRPWFESSQDKHDDGRYHMIGFCYNKKADFIYLKTAEKLGPPEKEKAGALESLVRSVRMPA